MHRIRAQSKCPEYSTLHAPAAISFIKAMLSLGLRRCCFVCAHSHEDGDFLKDVNPDSLQVLEDCAVEQYVAEAAPGTRVQFERTGYFCVDEASVPGAVTMNRIVTLRDTWASAPGPSPKPNKSTPAQKPKVQKKKAL
jgi:hypothetical protein